MHSSDPLQARYEATPYDDPSLPDLDLSRLLGLARLFGLGPTDDEIAGGDLRVLDLACASARHIRHQATCYPEVRFRGVDFSRSEIELGRKAIGESGASNVDLVVSDLREFEVPAGQYDLILCHGAFSWVADEVKDRIFQLCRTGLKKSGVAAIAYLTYPGWKQREAIRELLGYRTQGIEDPLERVRESALVLRLLHAGYEVHEESAHAQSLKAVVESMQRSASNAFIHDELGAIHDPCYFIQFAEWAGEWGMQYLAEVDLGSMAIAGLPQKAMRVLEELAPDFLETQQLIDFLVNRSGRTSLLVRDDAPVARKLASDGLTGLRFSTRLCDAALREASSADDRRFRARDDRVLTFDDPCAQALVGRLIDRVEQPQTLRELEAFAENEGIARPDVAPALLALLAAGHAEPRLPGVG